MTPYTTVAFSGAAATYYQVSGNWLPSQMIDGLIICRAVTAWGACVTLNFLRFWYRDTRRLGQSSLRSSFRLVLS